MSLPRLTLRKVSVLLHLEAGRGYKQIAADLGIHVQTVKLHVREIAADLPPHDGLSARDRILRYLDSLLEANADRVADVRANKHAA